MTIKRQEIINELNILKHHLINIGDAYTNPNALQVLDDTIVELKEPLNYK